MNKVNWEHISMQIITNAGMAKSSAIDAITCVENYKFSEANQLLETAEAHMIVAEKMHMDVIVQEAQGVQHDFKVLFMHAEDQMLTTQLLLIITKKFVNLYYKLSKTV